MDLTQVNIPDCLAHISLSVYFSICLSVYLSICLSLYLRQNSPRLFLKKSIGNTFELEKQTIFQATINLANAQRISRSATTPEKLYEEALAFAQTTEDEHGEMLCNTYLAICLLDKGQLKQAMQLYLDPLYSHKENMVTSTKILYLHHYGSACRSAADWGRAKTFLGEALGLAKQVGDPGSISACLGELGNIYRSEGR